MVTQLLITLLLIPILGFAGCVLMPKKWERGVFAVAIVAILLELVTFVSLGWRWLSTGATPVSASAGNLYASHHYTFALDFYFDWL